MIYIKSEYEINSIIKACNIWKKVKAKLVASVKIGISLLELDEIAKNEILKYDAIPTFYKYRGFKRNICISVNDCIIHGVPDNYKIKDKDLITFDVGVSYHNYICDAAFTIVVGNNIEAEKINKICYTSLIKGCEVIKPGVKTGLISYTIQTFVENHGFYVLKDFCGHGCGVKLHEDPMIPNYGKPSDGVELKAGMIICIEPMILTDDEKYFISPKDKWSVKSRNGKLTCHWEHMVLVTSSGYKILTE